MKKLIIITIIALNFGYIPTMQAGGAQKGSAEARKNLSPAQAFDMLKSFYMSQPLKLLSRKKLSRLIKYYMLRRALKLIQKSTESFKEDNFHSETFVLDDKYIDPEIVKIKKILKEENVDTTSIRKILILIREKSNSPSSSELITEMAILNRLKEVIDKDISTIPTTSILPATGPRILHQTSEDVEMSIAK